MVILPLGIIIFIFMFLGKGNKQGGPGQIFNFSQANLKQFLPNKDSIKFKNVAGLKEAKEELYEIVEFLKTPKKFTDLGAKIPRGVLLMGAPGTGKTLLARAVAGESGVPFFYISGSEFVEMFVGVGSARTKSAFAIAKKSAPSILFIDEIDAIGRERGSGIGGGQDEREQTLNQILVEMDGFDKDTHVIVMAATNRPDVLDQALLRPGRFDRRIFLDLPDKEERKQILKIHLDNKKFDDKIDLNKIAARTPGFSGADLENLINEGTILAARRNKKKVEEEDLLESIEKVMMGPERKSHVVNKNEKEITAYHEAGHALLAAILPNANPVHKISILPRGMAGGYTLQLPEEDRSLKTKSEFLDELIVYLGGYATEEKQFGEVSTGSSNDLKVASNSARAYVTKYGMSKLGPISFIGDESVFLGREMATRKICSEDMAARIDEEVNRLILDALKKAEALIAKNFDKIEKVAKVLLEKEILEKDEFYELIK
jgi:cell division protease FtsH